MMTDDNWSPPDASLCVPPPPPPTPSSTAPFIPQLTPQHAPPLLPTGRHHEQPHLDVIKYQSSADGEDNDTRLHNRYCIHIYSRKCFRQNNSQLQMK